MFWFWRKRPLISQHVTVNSAGYYYFSSDIENYVDRVMYLTSCDFHEACEFVADALGISFDLVWLICTT